MYSAVDDATVLVVVVVCSSECRCRSGDVFSCIEKEEHGRKEEAIASKTPTTTVAVVVVEDCIL